ncbi:palmitoyltransferase akr1 [Histoplasma mississippiense (nom. inval.)]|uniref:palmitoyltransferase akr1 n=1 Tax=Ajellomyces capsulatus (strain NAm1 / WU24) TaxID=2059318 RepID=UPI000157CF78|nr:palmitoyltransferase akr1 [Histoplasma mississippiense (nom. inval.)]EDN10969.1 palmitoyltransferase akr1 [Histoplasma mississippiense (nom. inval.)]
MHRLVLGGLRVAAKIVEDLCYQHRRFAKVGGVTERELAKLEISFSFLMDFELRVDAETMFHEIEAYREESRFRGLEFVDDVVNSTDFAIGYRSTSLTTGKAAAAPPKLSTRENELELKDIKPEDGNGGNPKPSLPIEEDIMQLARLGEIAAIQKLFESGKFNARYADEEGITPLHYALCKFLLESGADVNAKGGESVATAAMWAAQRCHYYIVNLLLQHGADPLSTDIQGYNILHLATIDGNAFLLVLLLHQEIPVDSPDPQGHTGLMWAAYKGFPACVDLFLRWGANVNAVDEGGLSPLHWALVKGSPACVQKIIEYGADRFAKTRDGKTPATVAAEMKTVHAWYRALNECGYDREGNLRTLPFGLTTVARTKRFTSKFFFFWPFLVILFSIFTLSNMVIYIGIPFTLGIVFGMQWIAQRVANLGPSEYRVLHRTPLLAGVFAGSLFWVGVRWALKVLPRSRYAASIADVVSVVCLSMTMMAHIDIIPARSDAECNILSSVLCDILSRDTFTIILTIWISIQLIWVSMLCVVQLVQISRNQTTYESMHGHTLDYANSASAAVTSAITTGTTSADIGGLSATGQGPNPAIPPTTIPSHRRPPPLRHDHGCLSQWKKLLGLDTFVATAQDGLDRRGGARSWNPFSRGVVTNCKDFWCDSQPYFGKRDTGSAMLGGETVNYSRLFDMPLMTRTGGSRAGSGMVYRSVAGGEDAV